MLLQQPVQVLQLGAGAEGDAAFAGAVEDVGAGPLLRGHGVDDGLHPAEAAVVHPPRGPLHGGGGHPAHPRHFIQNAGHPAHILHLLQLGAEVLQIEPPALFGFAHQFLGLLPVNLALRLLDKRQHIPHAEDAGGDALGVERLKGVEPLAHADELDGLAGYLPHRQSRPAAGVAVRLGEHHTAQRQAVVEGFGGVGGVLSGHGIHHEQGLDGFQALMQQFDFIHHRLVDGEAACRVHQQHINKPTLRLRQRRLDDGKWGCGLVGSFAGRSAPTRRSTLISRSTPTRRSTLPAFAAKELHPHLSRQRLQLLNRRRPIDIGTHHHHRLLVAPGFAGGPVKPRLKPMGQFGHGGGLTRPLQPRHQHHRRRGRAQVKRLVGLPHKPGEFRLHDLDESLPRRKIPPHLLPMGALTDPPDKILHHRHRHIRIQQRPPHLPQRLLDIRGGKGSLAANPTNRATQPICQIIKHSQCLCQMKVVV